MFFFVEGRNRQVIYESRGLVNPGLPASCTAQLNDSNVGRPRDASGNVTPISVDLLQETYLESIANKRGNKQPAAIHG